MENCTDSIKKKRKRKKVEILREKILKMALTLLISLIFFGMFLDEIVKGLQ